MKNWKKIRSAVLEWIAKWGELISILITAITFIVLNMIDEDQLYFYVSKKENIKIIIPFLTLIASYFLISLFHKILFHTELIVNGEIENWILRSFSKEASKRLKEIHNALRIMEQSNYAFKNLKKYLIDKTVLRDFSTLLEIFSTIPERQHKLMREYFREIVSTACEHCKNGGVIKMTTTVTNIDLLIKEGDSLFNYYFSNLKAMASKNNFHIEDLVFLDANKLSDSSYVEKVCQLHKLRSGEQCKCKYLIIKNKEEISNLFFDYHICCSAEDKGLKAKRVILGEFDPNDPGSVIIIKIGDLGTEAEVVKLFIKNFEEDWTEAKEFAEVFPHE